jgi:ribosomal protein S18 acetylase RimI-like enzyme
MQQAARPAFRKTGPRLRIVDITGANLGDIPDDYFSHSSCRSCLYWEDGGTPSARTTEDSEVEKRRWFNSISMIFGPSGKLVYQADAVVGWAQYAPASCFPRVRSYHVCPSEDAYLITCLAVKPDHRDRGIGESLLRAVTEDLRARGIKAVETFARRGNAKNPSGPLELYEKVGFRVKTDDEYLPLLRLELDQASSVNTSIQSFSRI